MRQFKSISPIIRALRRSLSACVLCLITGQALADAPLINPNLAQTRLNNWQQLINRADSLDNAGKLRAVNNLINHSTLYASDQITWGQSDYWASLGETLQRGQGDCEDFAIAKYFTLVKMGIPTAQLRLTHVTLLSPKSAHMVLAYYPSPLSSPLILDNVNEKILPATQRKDLLAVYSFNAEGIYLAKTPMDKIAQPVSLLSHWVALNTRQQRSNKLL
jgi:predicted transglutaminase-like cysteine proteinase